MILSSSKRPKREGYASQSSSRGRPASPSVSSHTSSNPNVARAPFSTTSSRRVNPTMGHQHRTSAAATNASISSSLNNSVGGAVELRSRGQLLAADAYSDVSTPPPHPQSTVTTPERAKQPLRKATTPAGFVKSPRPGTVSGPASSGAATPAAPMSRVPSGTSPNSKRSAGGGDPHGSKEHARARSPGRSGAHSPVVHNHLSPRSDPASKLRDAVRDADNATKHALDDAVTTNQGILDHMVERRHRADMLTQLYRDEANDCELDVARMEHNVKELQEKRKHLMELARTLELQVYQQRKRSSVAPKLDLAAQHGARKHGAAALEHTHPRASTPFTPSTSRQQYEALNRRLDGAKGVIQDLQREVEKLESNIAHKARERSNLTALTADLRKEVEELELHEVFVGGIVRESKQIIQQAGAMSSRVPYLERLLQELDRAEHSIRSDFEETQKHLMQFINADDRVIEDLKSLVQSRSGASGALPSLLRQLQAENEGLQTFAHTFVEASEKDRLELQATADGLQQRLQGIEDKIRVLGMLQPQQSASSSAAV